MTRLGLGGKLFCPDPNKFCHQVMNEGFCKGSCFGRGVCKNRACECEDGWGFHNCMKKEYVRKT